MTLSGEVKNISIDVRIIFYFILLLPFSYKSHYFHAVTEGQCIRRVIFIIEQSVHT